MGMWKEEKEKKIKSKKEKMYCEHFWSLFDQSDSYPISVCLTVSPREIISGVSVWFQLLRVLKVFSKNKTSKIFLSVYY